jgi:putative ATP-dependent endonuclease of OLD family
MRVRRLTIHNFRGVREGTIDFPGNTLLVGGNNVGKSTVCEALDLVLGPERLSRRPVVNEHDFFESRYLDAEGVPVEVRIEAILLDLSQEAELRFSNHMRRWNEKTGAFADEGEGGAQAGDADGTCWALPVVFIGKYHPGEDDFIGNTFLSHPQGEIDEEEEEEILLGAGLRKFTREHKRLCGFLFLRTMRTGARALSLQRGSLLDTILRIGGKGLDKMWLDTLIRLRALDPPIGDITQLKEIRDQVQARMGQFVNLSKDDATAFFASELTHDHLREVVRFFVASAQSNHLVPFHRQGTGAINMLVFALLTFIAELKEKKSVIFAMEEPEIALPPHTQRRAVRFVLSEMGQTIVTSHSPYVIEQFDADQIVMLNRGTNGALSGRPIDVTSIKSKTFKTERRQFAEAVLSRAVLVVEGSTEAAIFPVASTVLERIRGSDKYAHFDLAGVTVFDAGGDTSVPRFGPIFKALGKLSFGLHDKPKAPLTADATAQLAHYTHQWESPHKGVEHLLVDEIPAATLRLFLDGVKDRADYPSHHPKPASNLDDAQIKALALKVLKDRKGEAHGYGALLIAGCKTEKEIPATILAILDKIQDVLAPVPLGAPIVATPVEVQPGEPSQGDQGAAS